MDRTTFERLLYESEGATLDFKKQQYPFAKATDEEKSEILKDIIGFANAWRRSAGYILIGVAEKPGERAEVLGIPATDHLTDHSLQQFVNNLTNRPIRFQYEAFGYDGFKIGIIRIEEGQPRPIYLKKDYGKLKKESVFIRRGSSTDPSKPASLEEVALMGQGSAGQAAELRVEFASPDSGVSIGNTIGVAAELCRIPELDTIPDYPPPSPSGLFRLPEIGPSFTYPVSSFYRDVAVHHHCTRLYRPLRLAILNTGSVVATKVRVELVFGAGSRMKVIHPDEMPREPRRKRSQLDVNLPRIGSPPAFAPPGTVVVETFGEELRLGSEFGDIQPGRRMLSESVFFGSSEGGTLSVAGRTYAGNLPEPLDFTLTIDRQLTFTSLSVSQVKDLSRQYDSDG